MRAEELRFSSTHEWAFVSDNTATVGITDHAQKELGDIVFIEMPDIGRKLTMGEEFGTIESTKAASQLYIPLSGVVIEVNAAVAKSPELANNDPYDTGWLIKIKLANKDEVSKLMDFTQYSASLQ